MTNQFFLNPPPRKKKITEHYRSVKTSLQPLFNNFFFTADTPWLKIHNRSNVHLKKNVHSLDGWRARSSPMQTTTTCRCPFNFLRCAFGSATGHTNMSRRTIRSWRKCVDYPRTVDSGSGSQSTRNPFICLIYILMLFHFIWFLLLCVPQLFQVFVVGSVDKQKIRAIQRKTIGGKFNFLGYSRKRKTEDKNKIRYFNRP